LRPTIKVRWLALGTGAVLIVVAFLAGARVADTREGLVFEVIALLAGLAGVCLVLYGWVAATVRAHSGSPQAPAMSHQAPKARSANELLIGGGGLVIVVVLVAGIAFSASVLWAVLGLVLLMPMATGCAFLCFRFLRAPQREWKIDLERLTHRRD
jgi:hypothetical protein